MISAIVMTLRDAYEMLSFFIEAIYRKLSSNKTECRLSTQALGLTIT